MRAKRLAALHDASIDVRMATIELEGKAFIRMHVSDSGRGFDFKKVLDHMPEISRPYGRGIPLVKRLCKSVEYRGTGNQVEVVFPLDEPPPGAPASKSGPDSCR
jgi:anti-sigma regulatory factor (Ser/Thr protein kinase)